MTKESHTCCGCLAFSFLLTGWISLPICIYLKVDGYGDVDPTLVELGFILGIVSYASTIGLLLIGLCASGCVYVDDSDEKPEQPIPV